MSEPLQPPGDGAADSRGTAGQAGSGTQADSRDRLRKTSFSLPLRRVQAASKTPATRVIANRDSEPAPAKVGRRGALVRQGRAP